MNKEPEALEQFKKAIAEFDKDLDRLESLVFKEIKNMKSDLFTEVDSIQSDTRLCVKFVWFLVWLFISSIIYIINDFLFF